MKNFKISLICFTTLFASGFAQTATPPSPAPTTEIPAPSPVLPPSPVKPFAPSSDFSLPCEDEQKISENLTYENMFMKTVLALVGLLLLVFLGVWVLRKLSSSRTRHMNLLKTVKVLEKRPISPKSILYLVEVAGRKVLISESQLEVRTISHLDWIELPPSEVK